MSPSFTACPSLTGNFMIVPYVLTLGLAWVKGLVVPCTTPAGGTATSPRTKPKVRKVTQATAMPAWRNQFIRLIMLNPAFYALAWGCRPCRRPAGASFTPRRHFLFGGLARLPQYLMSPGAGAKF